MSSFRENNTDKTNRTGENNTGFVFLNSVEVKQNDNYGKTEPDQNGDDRSGKGNAPAKILLISGGAILLLGAVLCFLLFGGSGKKGDTASGKGASEAETTTESQDAGEQASEDTAEQAAEAGEEQGGHFRNQEGKNEHPDIRG